MRNNVHVFTLAILFIFGGSAYGAVWIGSGSFSGDIPPLIEYDQAVSQLASHRIHFDNYPNGAVLNYMDVGGVGLISSPSQANVCIQHGMAAGAEPASIPAAAVVGQVVSKPSKLTFLMINPVKSCGLVLMGLEFGARLKLYDTGQNLLGNHTILAAPAGLRRRIGVVAEDWEIHKVQIEPMASESYAIDDVEIGWYTPEPASLLLCCLIWILWPQRLSKRLGAVRDEW